VECGEEFGIFAGEKGTMLMPIPDTVFQKMERQVTLSIVR
jgi:hypothetical protein